jgi:hypothetical protein
MRCFLRLQFFVDALELFFNAGDLLPCGFPLRRIQLIRSGSGQSPVNAVHNGSHDFQIAQ